MKNKVGIIGFGNMGSAIAERIKTRYKVFIFDKDKSKTAALRNTSVMHTIVELCGKADTLILAVKPQDFDSVLNELKGRLSGRLIISIAAGIPAAYIERILGEIRVIRSMPNLPARIGKGMICLSKGKYAAERDLAFAERLLGYLGKTLKINEAMMNAATAVSGSGPGFFYALVSGKDFVDAKKFAKKEFFPALCKAAEAVGFSKADARRLAGVTAEGSIKYLEKSGLDVETLKRQVASKGGTTEAGLEILHKGGSLNEAVRAALKRARELARK